MFFKKPGWDRLIQQHAAELVRAGYRGLLERDADHGGLEHYVDYLHRGGSYADLLGSFVRSGEFLGIVEERRQFHVDAHTPTLREPDQRIAIFTNCQGNNLGRCIQALTGARPPKFSFVHARDILEPQRSIEVVRAAVAENDVVLLQPLYADALRAVDADLIDKVQLFPSISFPAFQPDQCYVQIKGTLDEVSGPLGPYHSSIAYYAWRAGISATQAADLYCEPVYQQLRFFDYWDSATQALLEEGRRCGMPLDGYLQQWRARGCFMHSPNHPKLYVLAAISRAVLQRLQMPTLPIEPEEVVWDNLTDVAIWPVYPEIAKRLGIDGSLMFKGNNPGLPSKAPIVSYALDEFISRSYAAFEQAAQTAEIACSRAFTQRYRDVFGSDRKWWRAQPQPAAAQKRNAAHPYAGLPSRQFWKQAVRELPAGEVDPVGAADFAIEPTTRVATAGSCFAQHISRRLQKRGFRYLITETAPARLSSAEAERDNYGVYSARYGNLYSARQLLQLFDRAYGAFNPSDISWTRADGRLADPFRPEITPDGFADVDELLASREQMFDAARRMFESADVFVFTLGLTEAWRSRSDGAVFPLAPGVVAGEMDRERYEFVNFGVADVIADLDAFIEKLAKVNPSVRVMLTVSPVPLAATFEDRHVLTASTYSKSVLRVAAEDVSRRHAQCSYFPSYEIITGSFNRGAYYDSDLRSVNAAGVDHVMRLFFAHYAPAGIDGEVDEELLEEAKNNYRIVCEEDRLADFAR
jgi:hypothetical protein